MKMNSFLVAIMLFPIIAAAQTMPAKLSKAFATLQEDAQFAHATIAFSVADASSGKIIFEKNSQLGVAPASTQKVITAVTAFEILGRDFVYRTVVGCDGGVGNGILKGNLYIVASGDPTLGSGRWASTSINEITQKLLASLQAKGIRNIEGDIILNTSGWDTQATPGGWIWDDVGNYYGAGAGGINWNENQYDLVLQPGSKEGDPVKIVKTEPQLLAAAFVNELRTGKPGSGDQSIIYLGENSQVPVVRGTVPAGVKEYVVKGSFANAPQQMGAFLDAILKDNGIGFSGKVKVESGRSTNAGLDTILLLQSPALDSMIYWFEQKSINLYGEAFLKTMAFSSGQMGSTTEGLSVVKEFWKKKGMDITAFNMQDGSGLSPANRVTTHALLELMQYARRQPWFSAFLEALPKMNGVKMKSGYINGVRAYTGYTTSSTGATYSFAFVINNFSGSSIAVRDKMWKLLDLLK